MALNGFPGVDPAVGRFPPQKPWIVIAIGVLAATISYVVGVCVQKSYAASFFAAPIFVGAIIGLLSLRRPFRNCLYAYGISLLLAVVTLREGVVCVLFCLPLLVAAMWIGAACTWTLRRWVRARKHHYFMAPLLLLIGLGWQVIEGRLDDPARHPVQVAESRLEIPAPPDEVFAALTERPIEVASRWPWFLRVGLPMPRRMEIAGGGPGGRLRLDFSQGTAHGHVTAWQPRRALSFAVDRYEIHDLPFHITRLGRGPHWGLRTERVEDWLTFLELRYTLEPTPGGTRLTRQTTWRRHLAPAFYFGWLQQQIIGRGQQRLLELVRERVRPSEPAQYLAGQRQGGER
ncbi:MAG TPA: SRPBCC family protein [Polyangia bacterium]|nr:SRPBCC family protein [Polyangia bacterium]